LASAVHPVSPHVSTPRPAAGSATHLVGMFLASVAALLLHGYHPYVVDASIYLTGVEKRLHPALFPQDNMLIAAHADLSIFSSFMAGLQRTTHIPLSVLSFLVYFALLYALLLICYRLGEEIFSSRRAGWGAALLMAACMPIPVAATSLLLIDPYLTSRSFSTDLSLLAILASIRNRWTLALVSCALAVAFHPLMGIYLACFLLMYFLVSTRRWRLAAAACAAAFTLSGGILPATRNTPVTASYREAVLGRVYYFLAFWHWYEIAGLVAPLILLALVWKYSGAKIALRRVAAACVLIGATSSLCCVCFVHPSGPYFLTRLQLLRSFHTIYALGIVMLGGAAATYCRGRRQFGWFVALGGLACGMFLLQRQDYSSLPDVEWPGASVSNPWETGLLWIRNNTPQTALFAMDPQLMLFDDDAIPGFRAIAERSILTDIKDEGLASLFPPLAPVWAGRIARERGLNTESDAERRRQLLGTGVNWLLLSSQSTTSLHCPYRNAALQVCSLARQ
jgi:hypothetical protein